MSDITWNLVIEADSRDFSEATPVMNDPMLPLPGLSPASGKPVVVKFDGGLLSSDGGVLALREVEQRLRLADRLAACIVDPRDPDQVTHSLADIIRFRLLMIGAGYEDGNDANCLRSDPMFKMALDLSPSDRELCSQSTISRLENLPNVRALLRMGRAMVDLYCESFGKVPKRITLDIDPELRLQEAIRLIFVRFRELGSARQVLLSLRADQIHFPRPSDGKRMIAFDWTPVRYRSVISVLKNPFYPGAYVYGKRDRRTAIVNGRAQKTYGHRKPFDEFAHGPGAASFRPIKRPLDCDPASRGGFVQSGLCEVAIRDAQPANRRPARMVYLCQR